MIVSTSFASEGTTQVIPNDAKLEYNQGVDFYKLGRYDEAVAAFRTAIRLYPDYIDAYYNLGSLLEYLQQNKEALDGNGKSGLLPQIDSLYNLVNKIKSAMGKYENVTLWACRGALLVIAVVLIVLGIVNGGMTDVLDKAIRICTECIGLG